MMPKVILAAVLVLTIADVMSQQSNGFYIIERKDRKQVDILFNKKLLTAYCFYDSIRKPILFPVNTVDGIAVTRGYPIEPKAGERTDHPHHTGIWLNYESVNGLDFWNNSTAIPVEKRSSYGTIIHEKIISQKANGNNASLTIAAKWIRPDNKPILNEQTEFRFQVKNNSFIIDRITTLTADKVAVLFKDVKDGMLAIRVARELELPSKEASSYIDDKGNITSVAPSSGKEVTGMYYSSGGLTGDSVWSSKGKWVMLTGRKDKEDITIAIIDHPSNVGYPAYWHARGYGLFSVNPLGRKIFSKGTEELKFSLKPNESVTFRYRIVIHSGNLLTNEDMKNLSDDFDKVK
jgi:hypothetical protein